MKKAYLYLMVGLLAGMLWSCYKDKGNYDYKDLLKIEIESLAIWDDETEEYVSGYNLYSCKINEKVNIRPDLVFNKEIENRNLKYTWSLNSKKVIGTEETLQWVADTLGSFYLVLDIEDEDHGTHFMNSFNINIKALYEGRGFLVLSEKNGERILSFFEGPYIVFPGSEEPYEAHIDLYGQANGTPLPKGTFKTLEQYRSSGSPETQLLALAPNSFVDFNAFSFKYIGNSDAYLQGPINNMRNMVIMQYLDLIETEEGKLYQRRKTTNGVFHYGKFLKAPVEYYNREGKMEVLEGMHLIPGNWGSSRHFILTFDDKNKRYLAISDCKDWDYNNDINYITAGQICEVGYISGKWPQEVTPLDDMDGCEVLYTGSRNFGDYSSLNYVSIIKQDGIYYYQEFDINGQSNISDGYSVSVTDIKQMELPAKLASVIDGNSLFCVVDEDGFSGNTTHSWLYVAVGNDLYLCNLGDGTLTDKSIVGPLTFNSKITALNGKCYSGSYLTVGLENGEFYILCNDEAKNHWTWAEKDPVGDYQGLIYYHHPAGELGKVIDIQFKSDGLGTDYY